MRYGRTALIFLHGSGSSGRDIRSYLEGLPVPKLDYKTFRQVMDTLDIDIYTPTAESRPYTPFGGEEANVWFDRSPNFLNEGLRTQEDVQGTDESLTKLFQYVDNIHDKHNYDHYFLGGFSMGGGLALQSLKLNNPHNKFRGVFSIGSFASETSPIFHEELGTMSKLPVLMMHGEDDDLISLKWGKQTAISLNLRNLDVQFKSYPNMEHEFNDDTLFDLHNWMIFNLSKYQIPPDSKETNTILEAKYAALTVKGYDQDDVNTLKEREQSEPKSIIKQEYQEILASVDIEAKYTKDIPEDCFPYLIEPSSSGGFGEFIIKFLVPENMIPMLISRPVLACGSSFTIEEDFPNGVKSVVFSLDAPKTAIEIGKRLFNRASSGSADLNPCPMS